jgi:cell division protein FtsB
MQSRRRNFFWRKALPVLGFVVMIYTLFSLSKVVWRNYQIEKEMKTLKADIQLLEEENQRLTNLITYFKTDAYKEKEARQRLGYKKPGEEVILVPNIDDKSYTTTETEATQPKKNYQLWWDFFFKSKS